MKTPRKPGKQPINPLIYIVAAGFIAGIALGYLSTRLQPLHPATLPPVSQLPTVTSTPLSTSTPFGITIFPGLPPDTVEITPQTTVGIGPSEGKLAPVFTLKNLDGQPVSLADFSGKPVLINVWATWCPPCRDEMTAFQAAYDQYRDKGLVVLGIDFTVQDTRQDVETFVNNLKLSFPILIDEDGSVSSGQYGVHALPMSFFIDSKGIIQHIQFGALLPADLEQYLAKILAGGYY